MINSQRKEVYIPIEIKPREFISQLLLSAELAKIGLRVYLGSKKSIDDLVENKKNKQGTYLYKGGGGTINKFKKLSKLVSSIAVLDQEISPCLIDSGVTIKNRFVKGCLKYVSRLYYVGPETKKKASEVLEDIDASLIKAYGWPRVDIWQPSLHHIWKDQIRDIKKKFPQPFLLFTSDFGCNSEKLLAERCLALEKRGRRKTAKDISWFKNLYRNHHKKYLEFINFLPLLDADEDIPTIIIRPHPSEDHSCWEEDVRHLSKIHVVYEGTISPWILSSEGVLHRGCTSAIEAAISRKKFAILSNFAIKNSGSIASVISTEIKSLDTLKIWLKQRYEEKIENSSFYPLLKDHINFSNKKAAEEIAQDLSSLSGEKVFPSDLNIKKSTKSKIKIFFYKLKNKIFRKKDYVPKLPKKNKMQDGIKLLECKYFLELIYPELFFSIHETNKDLIKIEFNNLD
ncbi:surface carbohydrate biosynthesis protein [Prochlorococcus marinus]|uniref:surface carbohydrate biosynthesis protein n=1 Tax=Prochlorococcus marinus TaxID=1219 RepID=UPI001ADC8579|nr:surface carbohydrate biosynthesis protein [Prochlorococcus marinus]MBO8217662.1 hypothetical protein [Prochlorococcus marinus XMU1405]MBW3040824.1 hypothetical protein [Prochlorococcus marinus str. MU1405]MBW3048283.1 hypothetical protein [Prochlorococcus marinus str. MU1406]